MFFSFLFYVKLLKLKGKYNNAEFLLGFVCILISIQSGPTSTLLLIAMNDIPDIIHNLL